MLSMNINEMLAHLAKLGDGDGRTVDITSTAPLGINYAPQDQRILATEVVLRKPLGQGRWSVKDRANFGTRGTRAQHRRVGAFA